MMAVPRDEPTNGDSIPLMSDAPRCGGGLLAGLTACSTRPPAQPENLCQIFREKPDGTRRRSR
jgi:hypothetical protein